LERDGKALIRAVPILGRVAAGRPALAVEHVEGTLPLPAEWAKGKEVFLLKVKGDSMSPFILPDDYVVVRSQASAENGDVVVTLIGDEATVKRFFKKGWKIELRPDNERWETIQIEEGSGRPGSQVKLPECLKIQKIFRGSFLRASLPTITIFYSRLEKNGVDSLNL
jgi:SOS regulatory protein LexA